MKIICLHPNLLRRTLERFGTTEIQRFQGAHGSAAAAAMAPLPGVTNRKLVHNLFSSEMSAGRGRLSPTLLAAPFRFIPAPGDITVSRSMLAAPFRDPCSHHVAAPFRDPCSQHRFEIHIRTKIHQRFEIHTRTLSQHRFEIHARIT